MNTAIPHRRFNPLTNEWILISPHRASRPWQGKLEALATASHPKRDPQCYLCPGNKRINGSQNPDYQNTFVFTNDTPALFPHSDYKEQHDPLFRMAEVNGTTKVICFSPRHDLTLAQLSCHELITVIETWQQEFSRLALEYQWVQIFENKGETMGCSSPHPHGQIWASTHLPTIAQKEHQAQLTYYTEYTTPLLLAYQKKESQLQTRIVLENDHWMVVVPFWAIWPFETVLLAKFSLQHLGQLDANTTVSLAMILSSLLQKYDRLFMCSFPYSMGWHHAPQDGTLYPAWQLHAHFYPPLLRSATVRKFMVGYEMLAEGQRDFTPEQAAQRLRDC